MTHIMSPFFDQENLRKISLQFIYEETCLSSNSKMRKNG